jgi:hypothetical protein
MAGQSTFLNRAEGCVLCRIVLFQARNVFEEVRRDGLILDPPLWLKEGVSLPRVLAVFTILTAAFAPRLVDYPVMG